MPPLTVTVVGTGYVGLVTGACLAGSATTSPVSTCASQSSRRQRGSRAFFEPGLEDLVRRGLDRALPRLNRSDVCGPGSDLSFIAVGTPSTAGGIDLSASRMPPAR
jgi:UDPglucose 6-dehydrogenase